ncbi:MAG: DMT family transporter [Sphingopyxis sp.]
MATPPAPTTTLHRPVAAIVLRLMAVAALGAMFALVKLSAGRGVHIVESIFYRQALALPLVVIWIACGPGFASLRTDRLGDHLSRMGIGLTAMTFNFLGMTMLPLAEATVIGFTVPLFATIFAAVMLKEATGRYRWGAVLLGFIGILVVVRPDSAAMLAPGHATGSLVALAGAVGTAGVTIFIRRLGATEPATTTVFWFTASSLVPLGVLMLHFGRGHDGATWGLLAAIGLSGGLAQMLLTLSLRYAPVAVVLPMDYTSLIWATLFGWLLFGALPVPETLVGAPIIIASGLIILLREHHLGKMAAARARAAQAG